MHRRAFIKKSCIACSSVSLLAAFVESCTSVRYATGGLNGDGLLVDLEEFNTNKDNIQRSYIIVRNEDLQFPICVYRMDDGTYSALWMQCSHQGAELQVAGAQLICPAHGSEFDRTGKVAQGPASGSLRTFPVTIINDKLFIDLRKQV